MLNFQPNATPTYDDFVNACLNGNIALVERALEIELIKESAADDDNYALRWTAYSGHLPVINRLLEIEDVRKNVTVRNNFPFRWAADRGHLSVVNRLLEIDAVREKAAIQGNYALRCAGEEGHLAVVNRLLQESSVRESATAHKNMALCWATEKQQYDVVLRLLEEQNVADYFRQHQQAFREEHKEFFKEIENKRFSKKLAVKLLMSENVPWSSMSHILGLAYHDGLCGKAKCLEIKKGDAEGLISCPIINQFRRRAVGSIERVQANREAVNLVATNSTAEPEAKRARVEKG